MPLRQVVTTTPDTSSSTPLFGLPDFGQVGQGFDQLQPRAGVINPLQEAAARQQQGLRGTLQGLFGNLGEGQRARIDQQAQTASNNVAGNIRSRGFAGSSLNLPGQLGVEGARQSALGDLGNQLLGQRRESETGISGNISDILFGASGQNSQLLAALLSSGGIGTSSRSAEGGTTGSFSRGGLSSGGGGRFSAGGAPGGGGFGGEIGGIQGGGLTEGPLSGITQPGFPEIPELSLGAF